MYSCAIYIIGYTYDFCRSIRSSLGGLFIAANVVDTVTNFGQVQVVKYMYNLVGADARLCRGGKTLLIVGGDKLPKL